jgi:hypothetical protein
MLDSASGFFLSIVMQFSTDELFLSPHEAQFHQQLKKTRARGTHDTQHTHAEGSDQL